MHKYLSQGPQTKLTDLVYWHAAKARNIIINDSKIIGLPEPLLAAHKTRKYINSELHTIKGYIPNEKTEEEKRKNRRLKDSVFRKRTLHQILDEGYFPTCSDIGVLFRGLMIAQGIPTAYVETFHENFLRDEKDKDFDFHGHVFARFFFEDKSLIFDPDTNKIATEEKEIFPYIIFREGLDSWGIGIHSYDDMHRLKAENIKELIEKYEKIKASLQKR